MLNLKYQRANSEIVQWNFFSTYMWYVCVSINYLHLYSYICIGYRRALLFAFYDTHANRGSSSRLSKFHSFSFLKWKHFGKHLFSRAQSFLDTFPLASLPKASAWKTHAIFLPTMAKAKKTVNSQEKPIYFFLSF